jgi:large subunit ribosomal protein L31
MAEFNSAHYQDLKVSCTCGNKFVTRSTYKKSTELKLEICGECHPFYTGKQKTVDTDRRIDKFYGKYGKTKTA